MMVEVAPGSRVRLLLRSTRELIVGKVEDVTDELITLRSLDGLRTRIVSKADIAYVDLNVGNVEW